ncbi:Transposase and inactivated derivatives [Blautia hydrogenotrophica]|nr:Transposase and inactivated derivatives [Blautia hydrogenotrophica]
MQTCKQQLWFYGNRGLSGSEIPIPASSRKKASERYFRYRQKIISMYAKGMTTRQISETIGDIYGFEPSEEFISDVTDKILPQIEDWPEPPIR